MKVLKTVLVLLAVGIPLIGYAQEVSGFTLTDSRTGEKISLSDYAHKKGVIIIFISNVCPYSVYYEGRITQLVSEYQGKGLQFILVNAHQEAKESSEEMKNKIAAWGLKIPYLADKEKKAMTSLGARKSPEAFILKPADNGFAIYYSGAIDNNPQVATDVKERYLKENIDNLLHGNSARSGSRPIGCVIR